VLYCWGEKKEGGRVLKKWWVRLLLVVAVLAVAYWLGVFRPGFEHQQNGTPGVGLKDQHTHGR
jgi:hypothetical protein